MTQFGQTFQGSISSFFVESTARHRNKITSSETAVYALFYDKPNTDFYLVKFIGRLQKWKVLLDSGTLVAKVLNTTIADVSWYGGNVFVLFRKDSSNYIFKYNSSGSLVAQTVVGTGSTNAADLTRHGRHIAIRNGNIIVVDLGFIIVYDTNLGYVKDSSAPPAGSPSNWGRVRYGTGLSSNYPREPLVLVDHTGDVYYGVSFGTTVGFDTFWSMPRNCFDHLAWRAYFHDNSHANYGAALGGTDQNVHWRPACLTDAIGDDNRELLTYPKGFAHGHVRSRAGISTGVSFAADFLFNPIDDPNAFYRSTIGSYRPTTRDDRHFMPGYFLWSMIDGNPITSYWIHDVFTSAVANEETDDPVDKKNFVNVQHPMVNTINCFCFGNYSDHGVLDDSQLWGGEYDYSTGTAQWYKEGDHTDSENPEEDWTLDGYQYICSVVTQAGLGIHQPTLF